MNCGKEKDTLEHTLWECEVNRESKKELEDKWKHKYDIKKLPNCLRLCGLVPRQEKIDEAFADIANMTSNEEENPPQRGSEDEESVDSEGFIMVAGDSSPCYFRGQLSRLRSLPQRRLGALVAKTLFMIASRN